MEIKINRVNLADSYKYSHSSQYPKNGILLKEHSLKEIRSNS